MRQIQQQQHQIQQLLQNSADPIASENQQQQIQTPISSPETRIQHQVQQTPISSPETSFSVPASVDAKPMSCTSQYSSADEVFDEFGTMQQGGQMSQEDGSRENGNERESYDVASLLKIEGMSAICYNSRILC